MSSTEKQFLILGSNPVLVPTSGLRGLVALLSIFQLGLIPLNRFVLSDRTKRCPTKMTKVFWKRIASFWWKYSHCQDYIGTNDQQIERMYPLVIKLKYYNFLSTEKHCLKNTEVIQWTETTSINSWVLVMQPKHTYISKVHGQRK